MTASSALLPRFIARRDNRVLFDLLTILGAAAALAVLAQIRIPLPFTPVPITGQTFGVLAFALLLGGWRAPAAVATYLTVGYLGAPVFSGGWSGLALGPTSGYLIGMLAAAAVVGYLADRGWAQSFWRALGACAIGTAIIFAFGLIVLARFAPEAGLLAAGFYPFLPGALAKGLAAAAIANQASRLSAE